MNEDLLLVIVFAGFIVLQRWILPRFGIHTCMSPKGCGAQRSDNEEQKPVIKTQKIDPDSL